MKSASKALLALYLLILLWLVLFKFSFNGSAVFDHPTRSINWIPFAASLTADGTGMSEIILNCIVFIPFGLLLSVNFKTASLWRKLAFVFGFSLTAEITQFVLAIGRTDITDVITNTLGGFLGLMLYDRGARVVNSEKLDRMIVFVGTGLLVLIIVLRVLVFSSVRFQSRH